MCEDIVKMIEEEKLIVIVRGVSREKLLPLSEALYAGGVRMMEITYSSDGSVSDNETAENIRLLVNGMKGCMRIGAGTVLTERQVELTAQAGGEFIISPDTCPAVIKKTKALGLASLPGALSPSEIQTAHKSGADYVKLFPVSALGVDYVKAVKAPLSHIRFLAVGGVNENNLSEYLQAGVKGFGVGTNIVDKNLVNHCDWAGITARAKKYTEILRKEQ